MLGASACSGVTVSLDFANGVYCQGGSQSSSAQSLPGWSFTRASTGTARTNGGTIVSFGSGVPRITDLGLLDELSATNLALQSQTLDSWTATNTTVTPNQIAAPDGTLTADLVTATAAAGNHGVQASSSVTVTNTTAYTFSAYAKAGTTNKVALLFKATDATQGWANFTLSGAGTAAVQFGTSASASILALANGWYFCAITATVSSAAQGPALYSANAAGAINYTGAGESAYFWGAQFELGTAASSYIITTTTAVTRAADALTLTYSPAGSAATVTYGTNSTASVSPTSPINLGSSSGGAWVGNYIRKLVVTP